MTIENRENDQPLNDKKITGTNILFTLWSSNKEGSKLFPHKNDSKWRIN